MLVLLGDIASGAVRPRASGCRGEPELAAVRGQPGVVRECQRALAERGLVSVQPRPRRAVRPEQDWDVFDPDVLAALVSGDRAADVLAEYLECRRARGRGRRPRGRAGPDAGDPGPLGRLRPHAAQAERARANPAAEPLYQQADIDFHRAIIRAARQPPAGADGRADPPRAERHLRRARPPAVRFERGLPEHDRILEAIKAGDAAGAPLAMREHLLTVEGYLRERRPRRRRDGGAPVPG